MARRPERARNDYATHLPVLCGLARIFDVHSVLEFGSGVFSTLTFLDRSAFPRLSTLHSIESNPHWFAQVESSAGPDPRVRMRLVTEPVESVLEEFSADSYDLVFVDHSVEAARRAATIRALAGWCHEMSLVVIHDFEVGTYQQAASSFPHRFEFAALNPSTGVAWKSRAVDHQQLHSLNNIIRHYAKNLSVDDSAGWLGVLHSHPELAPAAVGKK